MIKINLLEKKKPFKLPIILGVDLNQVKIKYIVLAYVFTMLMDSTVAPMIGSDLVDLESQIATENAKLAKIKRYLNDNKNLQQLLVEFEQQIERLKNRENQVKTIIDLRTNPKNIIGAITKIIPDDMWFDQFEITENRKIKISGGAVSYRSVGEFITKANELEFFGGSILIRNSVTKEEKINGTSLRIQNYVLEGDITSFGVID